MTHDEQRRADEHLGRAIRELIHQADRAEVEVIIGYEAGLHSVTADTYPLSGEPCYAREDWA